MQCEKFELRLNEVLDRREQPGQDADLSEHARQCAPCGRVLADYQRLMDGVDARSRHDLVSEAPPGLASRVLTRLEESSRTDRSPASKRSLGVERRSLAVLAVAASLLVAAYLAFNRQADPSRTHVAQETEIDPEALRALLEVPLTSFDEDNIASMCRATGREIAALPGTFWQVTYSAADDAEMEEHGTWARPVAVGVRPLTDSVFRAWGMLRSTLSDVSEQSDAASPDSSDTSLYEPQPPSGSRTTAV